MELKRDFPVASTSTANKDSSNTPARASGHSSAEVPAWHAIAIDAACYCLKCDAAKADFSRGISTTGATWVFTLAGRLDERDPRVLFSSDHPATN